MKINILPFVAIFVSSFVYAQNVNVPDEIFKTYLLNQASINTNSDQEIQVSEASAFAGEIKTTGLAISDLTGIEAFTALTSLNVYSNKLSFLDVSSNTQLQKLICTLNSIVSLDLSKNTKLVEVRCGNNNLSELNIKNGANNSINAFYANNNPNLKCIQVDDPVFSLSNWLFVDAQTAFSTNCSSYCGVNIPDETFKRELVNNTSINTNGDKQIDCSEASNYSGAIDISGKGISDLSGIEAFTSLTSLIAPSNNITHLDLSKNTSLTQLIIVTNKLVSLNVANGNNINMNSFNVLNNPSLSCIQVDNEPYSTTNWMDLDNTAYFDGACVVGLDYEYLLNNVSLFPNPAQNILNVSTDEKMVRVSILNTLGEEIVKSAFSSIDISNLPSGIFMVNIKTNAGTTIRRFIKE